jgi:hypothetical protein
MDLGGRGAVYDLMGMEAPIIVFKPRSMSAPKLVFDRTGEDDRARYSGLKMGQVLDDTVMAEALRVAQEKSKKGESMRTQLVEESYVAPFAGTYGMNQHVLLSCRPTYGYCVYYYYSV